MEQLGLYSDVIAQLVVVGILGTATILFMKDRWRFDIIALMIMVAIMLTGVMPYQAVLAQFGDPIIIIVASMFVISSALVHSGIVEFFLSRAGWLQTRPVVTLIILMLLVTLISAFVSNIGALAISIPIALYVARKSQTPITFFLLPLAFASHLGGFLTLIGTPRNILISEFRMDAIGSGFAMFDFAYVGGVISIVGTVFVVLYAYYFLPRTSTKNNHTEERRYTTEATIQEDTKLQPDCTVALFEEKTKQTVTVAKLVRDDVLIPATPHTKLQPGDTLLLCGTEEALTYAVERFHLDLDGIRALERGVTNQDEYVTLEVLIPPYVELHHQTWNRIPLQHRYGTNFIALHRQDAHISTRLAETYLEPNDILLLEGRKDSVESTIESLGFIPLAGTPLHFGQPTTIAATVSIIVVALGLASFAVLPLPIIFLSTVVILTVTNLVSLKQMYASIQLPVLILLAGMLTLGESLQVSGTADTFASTLLEISSLTSPVVILGIVLFATMVFADFVNSTAATVIMAPIAIMIAGGIAASVDPFLMAVAVGASSGFLTPIGHESNALVKQQAGYSVRDFVKIGLPLELIIFTISLPLILFFWPL